MSLGRLCAEGNQGWVPVTAASPRWLLSQRQPTHAPSPAGEPALSSVVCGSTTQLGSCLFLDGGWRTPT